MNRPSVNLEPKKNSYNLRIFLLMLVLTALLGLIGIRLFNLQILSHNYYKQLAASQHGLSATIDPQRRQIYLEAQDIRFYPEKSLASQVIGFLGYKGDQRAGQYGVEGQFQPELAGDKGNLGTDSNQSGSWISLSNRSLTPARDGDDIYLTI